MTTYAQLHEAHQRILPEPGAIRIASKGLSCDTGARMSLSPAGLLYGSLELDQLSRQT